MDTFLSEHGELVVASFSIMLLALSWLVKREFNGIQKHQDRQDARLDNMSAKLGSLEKDSSAATQDRVGLHAEIHSSFATLRDMISTLASSNREAHEDIKAMIRKNGNGGGK